MKVLLALAVFGAAILFSCGDEEPKTVYRPETPTPVAKPTPGDKPDDGKQAAWDAVKPLVQQNCASAGCHDGKSQKAFNTDRWFDSNAKNRIANGTMPPNRTLAPQTKDALLDSFKL